VQYSSKSIVPFSILLVFTTSCFQNGGAGPTRRSYLQVDEARGLRGKPKPSPIPSPSPSPVPSPSPSPSPAPAPATLSVTSFSLINADLDTVVPGYEAMAPGAVLNLASLPSRNLNIRVNTNPSVVGSVEIQFDSTRVIEDIEPYALCGGTGLNYNRCSNLVVGSHSISAVPYSSANLAGTKGSGLSISFSIVDPAPAPSSSPQPIPSPSSSPIPSPSPTPSSSPSPAPSYTPPVSGSADPELPRVYLNTQMPVMAGKLINIAAGGDLQAAINSALPGDTIVLAAGATFAGTYLLPKKSGSGWVIIRGANPPAEGTRVKPALHASAMPKIMSPTTSPAIRTAPGASFYRLIGLEIGVTSAPSLNYEVLRLGDATDPIAANTPSDIVIDRCYIHGRPTNNDKRGIALNSARTAIIESHISDIHVVGQDTQAIGGWNGPGPYKIVNNYLEGAGENVMFGGADPAISGLIPSDIEFRRNHLFKPLRWKQDDPSYAGYAWTVKNIFELKNARRVLIDGNFFENNWKHAQVGFAIVLTPRNSGANCSWCMVQDVTYTNNILRGSASAVNILGTDDGSPSDDTRRIKFANNLFEDISSAKWGGSGIFLQLSVYQMSQVTFDHNTIFHNGNILNLYGTNPDGTKAQVSAFAFTNNVMQHNTYGIFGTGSSPGSGSIATYMLNPYFARNVIVRNVAGKPSVTSYPASSLFPSLSGASFVFTDSWSQVGFVDQSGGNYRVSDTSPFARHSTEGGAIGADIDLLYGAAQARQ
jgi:hypothetical protein